MNFKNVFLPCLKLSILIGQVLLEEMDAREGWGFGQSRGLHSKGGEGNHRRKVSRVAEKTEKERGLKLWEGEALSKPLR